MNSCSDSTFQSGKYWLGQIHQHAPPIRGASRSKASVAPRGARQLRLSCVVLGAAVALPLLFGGFWKLARVSEHPRKQISDDFKTLREALEVTDSMPEEQS